MAELVMIMGHEVDNKMPYMTKKAQPKEFMILSLTTSFIINETSKVAIAK